MPSSGSEGAVGSGPLDQAGIAAALGVVRVDVADGGIVEEAGDQLIRLRPLDDVGVEHHAGLVIARGDSRRRRSTSGTAPISSNALIAPSRTKMAWVAR